MSSSLESAPQARFFSLMERNCGVVTRTLLESIWGELSSHYAQPHRKYHRLDHILFCLQQFDLCRDWLLNPDAVELALWFHDIIHIPSRSDNEAKSMAFFRQLTGNLLDPAMIELVCSLIRVTDHRSPVLHCDEQFICDIDLASFGVDWDRFLQDTADLLEEEGPDVYLPTYTRGKTQFFNGLLARESFFYTDFFNSRYESQAIANIESILGSNGNP